MFRVRSRFQKFFVELHSQSIEHTVDNKITILDIARRTGLSKGTVDRVLHNRGEVSKKSYDKVMKVIEELGYEPNLYASLLASNKQFTIAVLIPDAEQGGFWEISARGIALATSGSMLSGLNVVHVGYDQYDGASFAAACRKVLEMKPDGVVLAPMYKTESQAFAAALVEAQIPYVYVDSKLVDDNYLAYFGMPMVRSGQLCADLLTQGHRIQSVLIVRIRRSDEDRYDPNIYRRTGFLDYMLENCPDCAIHYLFIDPTRPERIGPQLAEFHAAHPEVRNLVMFNSRIYLIAPFIEKSGIQGLRVVGFDNLDANVAALKRGSVTMLIAQHPDHQVAQAIQTLSEFITIKKRPAQRDHLVHMDILTRYNAD
jgi:LacI family transcriptional regulator